VNKQNPSDNKSQPKITPPSQTTAGSSILPQTGNKKEKFSLDSPSLKDKAQNPKGGK